MTRGLCVATISPTVLPDLSLVTRFACLSRSGWFFAKGGERISFKGSLTPIDRGRGERCDKVVDVEADAAALAVAAGVGRAGWAAPLLPVPEAIVCAPVVGTRRGTSGAAVLPEEVSQVRHADGPRAVERSSICGWIELRWALKPGAAGEG